MKTDKLESRIEVRFTESEKKKVFQRAKKDKLTVSEWIRRRCLSDYTETITQAYIPIDMPQPMPTTPISQLLHDGEPCL